MGQYIDGFFSFRWPPDQTFSTLLENVNYQAGLQYFIFDFAIALAAILWGSAFCALLIKNERVDGKKILYLSTFIFLSFVAGTAIIIAELFILFLVKSFTWKMIIIFSTLTSTAAILILIKCRKSFPTFIISPGYFGSISTLLVFLALAFYQFSSADLWSLGDSTSYHVPYAQFFLSNQGFSAVPEHLIYPYHSLNLNLFYALGLLIDSNLSYIQTMHALFGTAALFGFYVFCLQTGQKHFVSVALMAVLAKIYIVHTNRYAANVDLGSMCYMLGCAFALYLWLTHRLNWMLIISAICFGMAIGTKYIMGSHALAIGLIILMVSQKNWRPMVLFACWSSAFGLWWYIRNMALTGNPVHPFASSIFGYFLWDQSDMTDQFAGWISRIPRDITGFLAMPYYAHMDHILNYQGAFLTISVLYGSTILSSLTSRAQNSLLLFSWIFLASWVFGTQDPRHLMSIMPLVFVHAGCVLMAVYSKIVPEKISSVVQIIFFIPTFSYFAIFVQQQFVRVFYTNVGESVQSTDSLMRQNDVYDIISHANEIFDEKSTVHEFYFRDVRLFFKGTLTGNQYGPHGYTRLINESAKPQGGISPEKLETNLKQRYSAEGFIIPNPPNSPYNQEEFDGYFDLMYRNNSGSIYRFKTPSPG